MVGKRIRGKKKETAGMAEKAADAVKSEAAKSGQMENIKTLMPWLPFVSWVIGAAIVTCLLFVFYNPSPTISAAYFVIVAVGFYILWRSRKYGFRKGAKGRE